MATIANRLLCDIVASEKIDQIPSNYVHPLSQRPNLQEVSHDTIPLIDLSNLNGPDRPLVIKQIAHACREYGFFQVKNHSVPESIINNISQIAKDYFKLPEEEHLKSYSDDPNKTIRLSTSFNVRAEKVKNWTDYLRLQCYPIEDYVHEWPENPESFKEHVSKYCDSVRGLAIELIEAISESLGLRRDYIGAQLHDAQHIALNHYPPCPQPDLTYGLRAHSDLNLITILLQANGVSGLQVFKDGKWIAVDPIPNTFTINVGDQIQVLSNDKYKSVLHRAVVNPDKERISIALFYCPSKDAIVEPAPELITDDNPAVYRQFTYEEYHDAFWDGGLAKEKCVDMFRPVSKSD